MWQTTLEERTLQHTIQYASVICVRCLSHTCCSVLQCVAVCCSVLQWPHVANCAANNSRGEDTASHYTIWSYYQPPLAGGVFCLACFGLKSRDEEMCACVFGISSSHTHTHLFLSHTHTSLPLTHTYLTHLFLSLTHTHISCLHTHISSSHTHISSSLTHTHISSSHTHISHTSLFVWHVLGWRVGMKKCVCVCVFGMFNVWVFCFLWGGYD